MNDRADRALFMANSTATHLIAVESGWYQRIIDTTLYCYEFDAEPFTLIDKCAGYYISTKPVTPISVTTVVGIMMQLLSPNIELRFMPLQWANQVLTSLLYGCAMQKYNRDHPK